MKIVDLNVLLYVVNAQAQQHEQAHTWWVNELRGDETIGLPWVVILGFLRLTTNPSVFERPLSVSDAMERIDTWLALPIIEVPTEKNNHWQVLRKLIATSGLAGNLTTDAHLAALALTRDAILVSCDNDFARFAGLRYRNPLRGQ